MSELADGLNIAAWKIGVALSNLVPCGDDDFLVVCAPIEWNQVANTKTTCGTATLADDADFKVVGCFPSADCATNGGLIP